MGVDPDLPFHVGHLYFSCHRESVIDMSRLATTSLIIARRAVASANGNPEFDAALVSSIAVTRGLSLTNRRCCDLLRRPMCVTSGLDHDRTLAQGTDKIAVH